MKQFLIALLLTVSVALVVYVALISRDLKKQEQSNIVQPATETNSNESNSQNQEGNIHVFSPKKDDEVGLPIKILGEARVFENTFQIRIKDGKGNILKEKTAMALNGDAGQFNLFQEELNYNEPKTSNGYIEVFDYSAKDGSEIDKVMVPIKFKRVASQKIEVYFGDKNKDPQTQNCERVYPVYRRVAYSKDIARIAIEELLAGPTKTEAENGIFTSINQGTKLNKIEIKNGKAYADFDDMLQAGIGGSCMVTNIRAQITETLKNISGISDVVISINGETEEVLQP